MVDFEKMMRLYAKIMIFCNDISSDEILYYEKVKKNEEMGYFKQEKLSKFKNIYFSFIVNYNLTNFL